MVQRVQGLVLNDDIMITIATKLPIGSISYRISSLCVLLSRSYCCWITAVKGNIKNERLAMVQAPFEANNRAWANHPAFSS